MKNHRYRTHLRWTGNTGKGTKNYRAYSRNHDLSAPGKTTTISGSADPKFRGDPARYSPEDLLCQSLAACHMLWYLHLCAVNKVVVTAYEDDTEGEMMEEDDGGGQFTSVTLRPRVTVSEAGMMDTARELHAEAARFCFIARSVNFRVVHVPEILVGGE